MECSYKTRDGRMVFKLNGEGVKDIFESISEIQEILESTSCGACDSGNVQFRVRTISKGGKTFRYYENACQACGCSLKFGQHMDGGTLFPKRKDKDGNWLPLSGWTKWQGDED